MQHLLPGIDAMFIARQATEKLCPLQEYIHTCIPVHSCTAYELDWTKQHTFFSYYKQSAIPDMDTSWQRLWAAL